MSGPQNCSVCTVKFGFFKKQYNCPVCHCTVCKDCLSFQIPVPGKGAALQNVCRKCYNSLRSKQPSSGRVSPPANFKREMERKQEQKTEVKKKQHAAPQNREEDIDTEISQRLQQLKQSHETRDIPMREIEERLRKLCDTDPNITVEEIEYRLAKLKGSRPPAIRVHSIRRSRTVDEPGSSRDEPESAQARKLIKQFTEEVAMETGHGPLSAVNEPPSGDDFHPEMVPKNASADDLIELAKSELKHEQEGMEVEKMEDEALRARLSGLNDVPAVPLQVGSSGFDFGDPDMDEESARLIQRLMEEDRLEQSMEQQGIVVRPPQKQLTRQPTVDDDDKDEELPWCFMCNDDAVVRCLTCERELFCRTCYRVVHQEPGMKGHKTEKFVPKPEVAT